MPASLSCLLILALLAISEQLLPEGGPRISLPGCYQSPNYLPHEGRASLQATFVTIKPIHRQVIYMHGLTRQRRSLSLSLTPGMAGNCATGCRDGSFLSLGTARQGEVIDEDQGIFPLASAGPGGGGAVPGSRARSTEGRAHLLSWNLLHKIIP